MDHQQRTLAHLLGAVVLGTVAAVDPGGWYPFGPTKWLVVATGIAVSTAYAAWVGLRPRLPRWTVVVGLGVLAWTAVAAALGRDPLYAWIGTPERRFGFATWVLLAACAALGSMLSVSAVRVWVRWVAAATLWCGGYVLVEWWFGAPVEVAADTQRLGGPFGSAAYLGAALCLLVPMSGWVASDRHQSHAWRVIGGGAAVLGAVALVGSGSRAAWLGFAVGGVVAMVAYRPRPRTVLVTVGVVAAALAVMAPRLDDVTDRSVSAASRLDEWAMAGRAIEQRPLLGAGPEGYRTVVAEVVTADYERDYGRDVLPDRAHNGVLDMATTTGLPGAFAYAALLGGAVLAGWRSLRRRAMPGLAMGVVAYVVQQLFLFPLAEVDPLFWIAAGILFVPVDAPRHLEPIRRRPAAIAAGVSAVALFASGVVWVAADRAASQLTLAGADRAAALRPDVVRYHLLQSAAELDVGTVASVRQAIASADDAVDISPHDPIAVRAAATARLELARITGQAADVEGALSAWVAIAQHDPNCRACQYGLGMAALLAGDRNTAEQALTVADDLSRDGDRRAADALIALRETADD